jgi:hypothetical protein
MGWGNASNVVTTNLDNSADDPSLARADLYAALLELTAVINGRNSTNVSAISGNGTHSRRDTSHSSHSRRHASDGRHV